MPTRPMKVIRGKRIRVTRLGACGAVPDYGESCAFVVSKGFVTVTLTAQVDEGSEIAQFNADGDLCVNDQSKHNFKRWNLGLTLCDVDPELVSMLTKVNLEADTTGDVVGYRSVAGKVDEEFAFELWSGIGDQACEAGEEFGYFLLPWVSGGTLGDITVENGASTFAINNAFTNGGGAWGAGPYDVVPDAGGLGTPLAVPMAADEHHLQRLTTITPPAVTDGCQPMPFF